MKFVKIVLITLITVWAAFLMLMDGLSRFCDINLPSKGLSVFGLCMYIVTIIALLIISTSLIDKLQKD